MQAESNGAAEQYTGSKRGSKAISFSPGEALQSPAWGGTSRALDYVPLPYGTDGPSATGDELEHHQISFSQCMDREIIF